MTNFDRTELALTVALITSPLWAPIAIFVLAVGVLGKVFWEGLLIQIEGV